MRRNGGGHPPGCAVAGGLPSSNIKPVSEEKIVNRMMLLYGRSLLAALTVLAAFGASAQQFPARPVRFLVPFPPGAGVDLVARQIGQKMAEHWGTAVVIDNRPGAGGTI